MPNIAAAGTYTKATAGFGALAATPARRVFKFAGSSLGDSCLLKYVDDAGELQTFEDGTITALPYNFELIDNVECKIVVTGTPNFNVTISM